MLGRNTRSGLADFSHPARVRIALSQSALLEPEPKVVEQYQHVVISFTSLRLMSLCEEME
jgi:hypothetical protein